MFTHRNTCPSYFEYLCVVDTEMNCPQRLTAQVSGGWSADSPQLTAPLGYA